MWNDTKGASPSNFEHVPATNQRDSIQVMHPTKVCHFDDANACFVKNFGDDILDIFCHHVIDLRKMSVEEM